MKRRKQPNWEEQKEKLIDKMGPIFYFGSFKLSIRTDLKTIIKFNLNYDVSLTFNSPPIINSIKLYIEEVYNDNTIIDNIINYLANFVKLVIPTKNCIINCDIIKIVKQKNLENHNLTHFNQLFKSKLISWLNLNESYKQLIKIKL